MNIQLIHGNCLEKMNDIPDGSIDMVMADLPYGTKALQGIEKMEYVDFSE